MKKHSNFRCLKQTLTATTLLIFFSQAFSQSVDHEKLKLLSCIVSGTESPVIQADETQAKAARDWINGLLANQQADAPTLRGRHEFAGACLQDITVVAAFGSVVVTGRICNSSTNQFRQALDRVGISLATNPSPKPNAPVLKTNSNQRKEKPEYIVYKGIIDLRDGISVKPRSDVLSYFCSARSSGTQ
jgi:hypothetical protein